MVTGQFNILGCVEVAGPGGRLPLTSGRQRALVAALALQPGMVVPTWRLVEALWGERPPRTAVRSLHSHVARLRPRLEECGLGGAIQTRDPGYLLAAEGSVVDAWRFEKDAQTGRSRLASGLAGTAADILSAALTLWRGGALADAEPTGWTAAQAARLDELRRVVIEDHCEALLCLGRFGDALTEVERLLAMDPARERLVGLHMIALCGCGRSAEALDAFQRIRSRLAEELGVDPSLELGELHTAVLRGAAVADLRAPGCVSSPRHAAVLTTLRPAQLPARVGYFTGRVDELSTLDSAPHQVVLICGPAGIGKTSLAIQFGHQVIDRFPDGQLFLDVRGHDSATAMPPGDIVARLLRGLSVPDERIPHETGDRVGLYRSLLSGKHMLIVLDNAAATNQITAAIPSAATSMLVVTSRRNLTGLMTHAEVHPVALDVLTAGESTALLARMLGAPRIERETEATERLSGLCGRLPLALRIAAAKLVAQPRLSIERFAAELAGGDRLAQLGLEDGDHSVEAVFASAYSALSPPAQRLFRMLGLHPGPHISAASAAATCATPTERLQPALAELVSVHLLTQPRPEQYRMHDLVRLYARRRAEADESPSARAEGAQRLVGWYLVIGQAAADVLEPGLHRANGTPRHPAPAVPFATRADALAFLESERDNLLPVVGFAAEHDEIAAACRLVVLLTGFFHARGQWSQRVQMCRLAIRAAQRLGDAPTEAEMHRALGVAYRMTRQLESALASHTRALDLLRPLGDQRAIATVYNNIGGASAELHRFGQALEAYRMALKLHSDCGDQVGVAVAERNLGYVHIRMDQAELSFPHLRRALTISRAVGHLRLEASALDSLGEAHLRQEQHDEALHCFKRALAVSREVGDRSGEMDALDNLGLTQMGRGDLAAAVAFLDQALAVSRVIAHQHGEARILNRLGQAHLRLANHGAAERHLQASAELRKQHPDPYEEAGLHRNLGDLAEATGRGDAASHHWQQAIGLYRKADAAAEADRLIQRRASHHR